MLAATGHNTSLQEDNGGTRTAIQDSPAVLCKAQSLCVHYAVMVFSIQVAQILNTFDRSTGRRSSYGGTARIIRQNKWAPGTPSVTANCASLINSLRIVIEAPNYHQR